MGLFRIELPTTTLFACRQEQGKVADRGRGRGRDRDRGRDGERRSLMAMVEAAVVVAEAEAEELMCRLELCHLKVTQFHLLRPHRSFIHNVLVHLCTYMFRRQVDGSCGRVLVP